MLLICAAFLFVAAARADEEADRAALRKIKAAYEEAVNSNDLSKVAPFVDENATGAMLTAEEISGFKGLEAYNQKIRALIGQLDTIEPVSATDVKKASPLHRLAVSNSEYETLVHVLT